MAVIRHAKSSPRHNAGPNETVYCVGCQAIKPNGFWIYDQVQIGPTGIFICDDCLEKAKKAVRTNGVRESIG